MSHLAFFAHANVFYHGGQPVPIELSIASIPEDGKDPEVICIKVDHSKFLTTARDSRANRYINERLSLKCHLPGSVFLEYLAFCVRGGGSVRAVVRCAQRVINPDDTGVCSLELMVDKGLERPKTFFVKITAREKILL
ncbi:uncharacterized protein TNCV_3006851 [Trichonephila clavipes]|nr:uncharacterized protein TNCV_3006851 [Trichonephila clavipes]